MHSVVFKTAQLWHSYGTKKEERTLSSVIPSSKSLCVYVLLLYYECTGAWAPHMALWAEKGFQKGEKWYEILLENVANQLVIG